jgi:hypothetical protein
MTTTETILTVALVGGAVYFISRKPAAAQEVQLELEAAGVPPEEAAARVREAEEALKEFKRLAKILKRKAPSSCKEEFWAYTQGLDAEGKLALLEVWEDNWDAILARADDPYNWEQFGCPGRDEALFNVGLPNGAALDEGIIEEEAITETAPIVSPSGEVIVEVDLPVGGPVPATVTSAGTLSAEQQMEVFQAASGSVPRELRWVLWRLIGSLSDSQRQLFAQALRSGYLSAEQLNQLVAAYAANPPPGPIIDRPIYDMTHPF